MKFRSGDTILKDESMAGRPSDFDNDILKENFRAKSTSINERNIKNA